MNKSKGESLHQYVAAVLRERVRRGEIGIGEPMSSEADLASEFGVARGTVRQALAHLRAEGVISGGRGRQPVVRPEPMAQPFSELVSFSAWAASMGVIPAGRVIELVRRPVDPRVALELQLQPRTACYHLVRVRLADGLAVMVERTVFAPGVGEAVAAADLEQGSIYATLGTAGIRFERARQAIDAVSSSALDSRLLGVRRGSPLLRVRRTSEDIHGRPLEWADDRYRPDMVALTIDQTANRPGIARRLTQGGQ
ncbi:MAG: GntR family transcriptional regulator [Chloroflexota bacterium]